jgi:hypothetical protein
MELAVAQAIQQAQEVEPRTFKARQEFFASARDRGTWKRREFKPGDLRIDFNDAAEFAEGAGQVEEGEEDLAPDWKAATKRSRAGTGRPARKPKATGENVLCAAGEMQSMPIGMPRASAISSVIFAAGSIPP